MNLGSAGLTAQCHLVFPLLVILHKLWGGQSWPQPPFWAALADMQRGAGREEPAGKPAAGKIARPTIYPGNA